MRPSLRRMFRPRRQAVSFLPHLTLFLMHSKGYSLLLLAAAFLALPLTANAQSLARPDGSTGAVPYVALEQTGTNAFRSGGGIVLTQSELLEVEAGAVACALNDYPYTTTNSWWRMFDLSEVAEIENGFTATSASVGIGTPTYENDWPTGVAEVRFYTVEGDLSLANLTAVGDTASIELTPDIALQVIDVDVSGVSVSADAQLAVEVYVPQGFEEDLETGELTGGFDARAGINSFGATGPTYIYSYGSCGIADITDVAAIGFPDAQLVLSVTGTDATVANEDGAVAKRVTLGQAYPNPVVGQAAIPFSLESAQHVTIAVYDALGREVATTAATFSAGEQSVRIDTSALPNGVYFYRINAGETTQTRKMVVMQ